MIQRHMGLWWHRCHKNCRCTRIEKFMLYIACMIKTRIMHRLCIILNLINWVAKITISRCNRSINMPCNIIIWIHRNCDKIKYLTYRLHRRGWYCSAGTSDCSFLLWKKVLVSQLSTSTLKNKTRAATLLLWLASWKSMCWILAKPNLDVGLWRNCWWRLDRWPNESTVVSASCFFLIKIFLPQRSRQLCWHAKLIRVTTQ